jgi:hypothetical protein
LRRRRMGYSVFEPLTINNSAQETENIS